MQSLLLGLALESCKLLLPAGAVEQLSQLQMRFQSLASWRGCVCRCCSCCRRRRRRQLLLCCICKDNSNHFSVFCPLSLSLYLLLTLIHIHVRQMANGCTVNEIGFWRPRPKWPKSTWLLGASASAFLARAQITWITWPAFVMLSIIVYDDWVPLWTRIHSIHQFSSVQFSSVQCVRLFVVHSSPVPIQISFRPSATTKCINNRQTNFTFITKERILYICMFIQIYVYMYVYVWYLFRNMSKSLPPGLFSFLLPLARLIVLNWNGRRSQCKYWSYVHSCTVHSGLAYIQILLYKYPYIIIEFI